MSRRNLFTLCLALLALLIIFLIPRSEPKNTEAPSDNSAERIRPPSAPSQVEPRLSGFLIPVADEIRPHPLLQEGALENGLQYQILTLPNPDQQISLRLVLNVGSFMEEDHERGIAHFLEHLVFNGTRNFPQGRAMEEFQRLGLKSGQHTNANTSYEYTVYKLDLPNDSPETLTPALQFFRDVFDGLLLKENEVNAERDVVLEEMNQRSSSRNRRHRPLALLFPNTLIAKRNPIGTLETIAAFSQADFTRFHQKWYTPNRGTIMIAGDIDPDRAEDLIKGHFSSLPWRKREPTPEIGELPPSDLLIGDVLLEDSSDRISLYSASPPAEPKTTPSGFRVSLIDDLVHEMLNSRWDNILKNRSSSRFTASSSNTPQFARINYCGIYFGQDHPNLDSFLSEWNRILQNGFLPSEFDLAKKDILFSLLEEVEELGTQSAATLANRLVTAHREQATFTSPLDDLARVRHSLPSISLEECHTYFQTQWKNRATLIQQRFTKRESTAAETTNTYLQKQAINYPPRIETPAAEFSRPPNGEKSDVLSRKKFPKLQLTQITLGNGLKLNLRPTKNASDLIHLSLTFGRGIHSIPIHHPGLKALARSSYFYSGIKGLSKFNLDHALRHQLVNWDYRLHTDHHRLSGVCSRSDLLTQCQLLHALLIEPGHFTDDRRDFSYTSPARLEKTHHHRTNTPTKYWYTYHNDFLTNSDSRFRYRSVPELISTKSRDLRDWLKDDLLHNPIELTLSGDFEIPEVLPAILETFGRLPQRAPEFPPLDSPLATFEAPSTDLRKIDEEGERAYVSYFFHTPRANASGQMKAQFTLLKSIFKNRVREHIRENLGLSYSPNVAFDNNDYLGDLNHFYTTIPTSVGNVSRVQEAMTEVIGSFLNHPISEDELTRARLPIMKWQPLQKASPYYWTQTLALASRQPTLLDDLENEAAIFEAVSLEELQKLSISTITYGACEFTVTQ